eukprot:6664419-Pyramimonas_sp.AAC.1
MPIHVEEGGDSKMEENWDVTPDPWHDTELQHVNYEEVELSEIERQLVNEGGFVFTPAEKGWR